MPDSSVPRWLLAMESSSPNGGAALLRDDDLFEVARLAEGLRHGRELIPAASRLLTNAGITARSLWGVAVSAGPGSYTGTRIGVMAAKALSYGAECRLTAVSSLAALAETLRLAGKAVPGNLVVTLQDARRDEVYAGFYCLKEDETVPLAPDTALAPEEARACLKQLLEQNRQGKILLAGSGYVTYAELFRDIGGNKAASGIIEPEAVARLGRRQFLREHFTDPFILQPVYPRRHSAADWTGGIPVDMA